MAEKVYVHLDRPTYLIGETVWFSMWVTDEQLKPSPISSIGYLEFIDSDGEPVIQHKVAIQNGKGEGSFRISSDLATRVFRVRAYTQWMKNFSDSHFFESFVYIINPFLPLPVTQRNVEKPDLQFFPEGGHALIGVENKIAFKGQNSEGVGFEFKGRILDENGKTVASFQPQVHGIGHFLFTPVEGKQYSAEITDNNGNTYQYPFDIISERGYALRVTDRGSQLQIDVFRLNSTQDEPLFLLLYKGENSLGYRMEWAGNHALLELDKTKLNPGVNVLTLFDSKYQPVAERLFFQPLLTNQEIQVTTGKAVYGKREKISIELQPQHLSDTVEASLAVFLTDDLPEPSTTSINTYLLLTSALKGQIENPDYYFAQGKTVSNALDDVMLTHGWRRFRSEELISTPFQPQYLPEPYGHLITGRIVSQSDGTPLDRRSILAAFPSAKAMPWVGITNENGAFILETKDFFGPREMVFQTNFRIDSTCQIIVNSPFAAITDKPRFPSLELDGRHQAALLKRSINMQSVNSYFPAPKTEVELDTVPFYDTPDFRYYLDDYTRFPTMEEVLSEYIPPVSIRLRRGKYYARVIETGVHKQYFTEDPLILIDGIPVFDTDRIIHFDPLKVKRADVVNRMYFLGPLTFPGIISFSTYTHDLSGFEVDPKALIVAYDGVLEKREFYVPNYDQKKRNSERLPDFRNLLFWTPSVKIAPGSPTKIEFNASDQPGNYRIILQGLSKDGVPVSAKGQFEIKD